VPLWEISDLRKLILVTGASGYIASRLIPRLLEKDYRVRVLARRRENLTGRAWHAGVEVVEGDVTQPEQIAAALEGVNTAYYLIHNMAMGRGYTHFEMEGAHNFTSAAERAGVQHIVYLGGLADPNDKSLAPHLRSRMETGEMLRQGKIPVTEFRAGVIAGPGSISFEMIRFMTEAFPIIVGPAWLKNKTQPIATENVVDYLAAALENFDLQNHIFEIGGSEIAAYGDLMLQYAHLRGLKRKLILLPGIPLCLMAFGVAILTPVPRPIAYALIAGLANDSVVQNDEARRTFPSIQPINFEKAAVNALHHLSPAWMERVWEGSSRDAMRMKHEGFFVDYRRIEVNAPSESVYQVITSMGGYSGWPYANWLWQLRGKLDQMIRNHPPFALNPLSLKDMREGDPIDYYRVEALEPNHLMRLHSELCTPGEGWMEWRIDSEDEGSVLTQTAFFAPRGLLGFLYWYGLDPLHRLVFRGLIKAIKRRSET
jgi:uncharacterized protein YbjT (DUF2867 family)